MELKEGILDISLAHIKTEDEVLRLANTFYKYFPSPVPDVVFVPGMGPHQPKRDTFWDSAGSTLLKALIGYIVSERPEEKQNLWALWGLLGDRCSKNPEDEEGKTAVDLMFEDLRERDPEHFTLRFYEHFRIMGAKERDKVRKELVSIFIDIVASEKHENLKAWLQDDEKLMVKIERKETIEQNRNEYLSYLEGLLKEDIFENLLDKPQNPDIKEKVFSEIRNRLDRDKGV